MFRLRHFYKRIPAARASGAWDPRISLVKNMVSIKRIVEASSFEVSYGNFSYGHLRSEICNGILQNMLWRVFE